MIPNPHSFKHATLLIDDAGGGGGCTIGDIDYFPVVQGYEYLSSYLLASGEYLSVSQNSTLFGLFGATFGDGGE